MAYKVLIDRHRPRLVELCRHVLPPGQDAQDAVEEVVAVARAAMLAEQGPINPRPWLYRIARTHALNRRPTSGRPTDPQGSHLSESADGHMRVPRVLQDVRSLPEAERTALFLRETERLSYEDIAEAMDEGVPSVKQHLVRARMALADAAVQRGAAARAAASDPVRRRL